MKDQISQVLRAVPSRNHRWSVQLRHLRTLPVTFLPYICFLSNLHNNKKPTKKLTLSQMCCQYYITPEPPRQKETKWTLHRTVRPKPTGRHTSLWGSCQLQPLWDSCLAKVGVGWGRELKEHMTAAVAKSYSESNGLNLESQVGLVIGQQSLVHGHHCCTVGLVRIQHRLKPAWHQFWTYNHHSINKKLKSNYHETLLSWPPWKPVWYQYWTYNHHSVNKKQTTVQLFFHDLPKNPANTVLKDGQYLVRGLLAWEHKGKG